MALKINVPLTTQDGGIVEAGAYVVLNTHIPQNTTTYRCNIVVYRSKEIMEAGNNPVYTKEIKPSFFVKSLTQVEYDVLTMLVIQDEAVAYLEKILGSGNISVI